MFRLCIKDVLRSRFSILLLVFLNLGYIAVHLMPDHIRENFIWGYEVVYIISIAILIPIMLAQRYSDTNKEIVNNVVAPKVKKIEHYHDLFLGAVLGTIVLLLSFSILILMIFAKTDILRCFLFWLHILLIGYLFILLFTGLVNVIDRFLLSWVFYVFIIIGLILWNSPASYLWFIYTDTYPVNTHWLGKIVLVVAISIGNILIKLCYRGKNGVIC